MGELIVVAGIPGTRIRRSLAKFADYAEQTHGRSVEVISLEDELQSRAQPEVGNFFPIRSASVVQTFLFPRALLRRLWAESLESVMARAEAALSGQDVLLTLHLSYYHQLTKEYLNAADLVLLLDRLIGRASKLVTLVDDVYDCHRALFSSGTGMFQPPREVDTATLDILQILDWRSVELLLADTISASGGVPHYVFAVKHPIETFYELLFVDKRLIYFSHPISEPRRMHAGGDVDAARSFVQQMGEVIARLQGAATVIEPTAIDEFRFSEAEGYDGNLAPRWPFGPDLRDLLYVAPPDCPPAATAVSFPAGWEDDERDAVGASSLLARLRASIEAQIDSRDHVLVEQSERLACYRPVFEGHQSRGVEEELQHIARLVKLGVREPEMASVVYSPNADHIRYPRRRFPDSSLPEWRLGGVISGDDEAFDRLTEAMLSSDEISELDAIVQGDASALLELLTRYGIDVAPDKAALPTGALGAGDAPRVHLTAEKLALSIEADSRLYLDELVEEGIITVVESEQMFFKGISDA